MFSHKTFNLPAYFLFLFFALEVDGKTKRSLCRTPIMQYITLMYNRLKTASLCKVRSEMTSRPYVLKCIFNIILPYTIGIFIHHVH